MAVQERSDPAYPHTEKDEHHNGQLPDWDDFRLLLTIIQSGSFSRAAAVLGLTQPTISRRIARLEKTIGVSLVDRTNNGATLTIEGQRVAEELFVAHGAIHRAIGRARSSTMRLEDVKLVTTDGLAAYWLPYFLPSLFDQHPDLELRVYTASEAGAEQRGHFDLSIHFLQPNDPNLITTRLGTLHFVPFASPAYLSKNGWPRSTDDLSHHRLLDYILYLIDKGTWMTRLPLAVDEARTQFFTNSSAALAESVRKGVGIALLPTYGVVFERGFVPLEVGIHYATPFWLCYQQESLAKKPVRTAIAFLKHIFNRRTMSWFDDDYVSPLMFPATTPEQIMGSFVSPRSLSTEA